MDHEQPRRRDLSALFFITTAIISLEICFLRLFSVTIWYHFAFLAISLAMFGIACAGLLVYLFPARFPAEGLRGRLAAEAVAMTVAIDASLFCYLKLVPLYHFSFRAADLLVLAAMVLVLIVPFFFGGLIMAQMFRHWAPQINKIYAYDLVGSSLGCLVGFVALSRMSGPDAILFVALLPVIASLLFGGVPARSKRSWLSWATLAAGSALLAINIGYAPLRVDFAKGQQEPPKLFEAWNSFSRVAVFDYRQPRPFLYNNYLDLQVANPGQYMLQIDASAASPLTRYDGDPRKVQFLRWDITALQYLLRPTGDALIIGLGGGKDILTALLYDYDSIVGIEYNPIIIDLITEHFRDFTGDIYRAPNVEVVQAEGRNYVRSTGRQFDILQMTLVDTWAATAAGAFAFTENNLYTREAFDDFLARLKPEGLFSCTRYIFRPPRQSLRMLVLADAALRDDGAANPAEHIVMLTSEFADVGVVNMLVKKTPFSPQQLADVEMMADKLGLTFLTSPRLNQPTAYADFLRTRDKQAFIDSYPYDISLTTDDRPFFFHQVRPRDFFRVLFQAARSADPGDAMGNQSIVILTSLLLVLFFLTLVFFAGPLGLRARYPRRSFLSLMYFLVIGLGFMFIEIPLMQKFILFLGHPLYALPVVLLSLLLFSGVGSYFSQLLLDRFGRLGLAAMFLAVAALCVGVSYLSPLMFHYFLRFSVPFKIVLTILSILPLGFCMGIPFPSGVRYLNETKDQLIPWAWSINGAAGVLASVAAVFVAIAAGFAVTMSVGAGFYLLGALLALKIGKA